MSCFKLPDSVRDDIKSLVSNFWWSSNGVSNGMKLVSWRKLSTSKNEGGLSYIDFQSLNLALLAKQGWRI